MLVQTPETEFLAVEDMLAIIKDWFAGCPNRPGNTDVLEVFVRMGIEPAKLAEMARELSNPNWTRYDVGKLILELTGKRRFLAALARHGKVYHGLRLDQARRDLKELRDEAREIVQREVLQGVGR